MINNNNNKSGTSVYITDICICKKKVDEIKLINLLLFT